MVATSANFLPLSPPRRCIDDFGQLLWDVIHDQVARGDYTFHADIHPGNFLLRFDGREVGDEVHLELNFLLFRQAWVSRITEVQRDERDISFVDEGIELPFFLTAWRHRHRIAAYRGGTVIFDEIEFRASNLLLELFLWPVLYLQFLYRRPVYRRFFQKAR